MEQIYAFGVTWIEYVQYWFKDNANFFEIVNHVCNPQYAIDYLFPLLSAVDSVFAAQLLLCLAFGGWLNAVMKWWLLEDRPYWWIRETTFYSEPERPTLQQTLQTCETGPGSPSGHSMTAAMMLILSLMWISHVMHDKKYYIWWWKYLMYPLCAVALLSVMLARLYVAAHFPHQCLIGALVGAFLAPALCIYVTDPFIWQYGYHATYETSRAVACHVLSTLVTAMIAGLTYAGLRMLGWDPHWTVKLAFRWCENPETIRVSTTPMYALVVSTGSLLGWALCVTPAIAEYRHYTKHRSILISLFTTAIILMGYQHIQENMCKSDATRFYAMQFAMAAAKPMLLLRVTPMLSMWPFRGAKTKAEMLLKVSKLREASLQHGGNNYGWLSSKPFQLDVPKTNKDLERLRPMIQKMSSENCAKIAVKLDAMTEEEESSTAILTVFKKLLEDQYSIQLMEKNVVKAKEKALKKSKVNRVQPVLVPDGRQPTVSFILYL